MHENMKKYAEYAENMQQNMQKIRKQDVKHYAKKHAHNMPDMQKKYSEYTQNVQIICK